MTLSLLLPALALALAAGLTRGVTGFGGALVLTAPLSLLVAPKQAIITSLLLETFAALHMVPAAIRMARWRRIAPPAAAACLTVPIGGWLLAILDPGLVRNLIAVTVLVFAVVLLMGYRYSGAPRTSTAVLVGATSGVLTAITSVGAPPVILYLLSGPDPVATTRAHLTLFIVLISGATLTALIAQGTITPADTLTAAWLAPGFFTGVWLGTRLFPYVDDRLFRRIVLALLVALAAFLLLR